MSEITLEVGKNRKLFLSELRSGKYEKGCVKSDEAGNPVIESESDDEGFCCCAVMAHLFGHSDSGKLSLPKAVKALGLTNQDCKIIQSEINDRSTTLKQDADEIERRFFLRSNRSNNI